MRRDMVLDIVWNIFSRQPDGVTAEEVADAAGIKRNNASADLNDLFRLGFLKKDNGRPVRFIPVKKIALNDNKSQAENLYFDEMIGSKGSLRTVVEQAKAAISYPPHGLPTLISGPTGVGKSHLAEAMYRYAINIGFMSPSSPFNVFNCADYAANPQLLLAQLFGHVKGAYTGADSASPGLVSQSKGGVLFLDEIHRLPP